MRSSRFVLYMILLAASFVLNGCGKALRVIVTNESDFQRWNAAVVIKAETLEMLAPGITVGDVDLIGRNGQIIPMQSDDIDGDGVIDEYVFVSDFGPGERKYFELRQSLKPVSDDDEKQYFGPIAAMQGMSFGDGTTEANIKLHYGIFARRVATSPPRNSVFVRDPAYDEMDDISTICRCHTCAISKINNHTFIKNMATRKCYISIIWSIITCTIILRILNDSIPYCISNPQ